jgi:hypothetical protein
MKSREEYVQSIKDILVAFGHFSIGEIETDCSPMLENTKGNLTHLIEYFSSGYCEVNVYSERFDDRIDSYYLNYEDLTISELEEVLEVCKKWEDFNS